MNYQQGFAFILSEIERTGSLLAIKDQPGYAIDALHELKLASRLL